jgi:hypothetical protein
MDVENSSFAINGECDKNVSTPSKEHALIRVAPEFEKMTS